MIKPIALTFALAMAFAPAAALAQYGYGYGYMGPPPPGLSAHADGSTPGAGAPVVWPSAARGPESSPDFPQPERLRQDHVHVLGRRRLLIGPSSFWTGGPNAPAWVWGIGGNQDFVPAAGPRTAARRASGRPPAPRPSAAS
jgi:hypothetical protein